MPVLYLNRKREEGGMGNLISVPEWADALFKVLDPASCQAPITPKVEDGTITADASLLYDLGIGSPKLQTMVYAINGVIDTYRQPDGNGYVDTDTLANTKTIGDLTNDVYGHLGTFGSP